MDTLLRRFLRYAKIDTQADENGKGYPSTPKQLELSRLLADECRSLALQDVKMSEFGIVTATIPATAPSAPAIAWLAHVDTSPETSGANVQPVVHEDFAGEDITLPGDPSKIIRVADNPELKDLRGGTVVTSDGTTLLGADDKSGIAVIMTAAAHLVSHPEIKHGPIRICFTCDEEIGHGVDKLDIEKLDVVCAYTLDGDGAGKVDFETFSANLAIVKVTGVNTHPSVGKNSLVNAIRILSAFVSRMPWDTLSPETTDGRDGFMHPYVIEGGVARATARVLLRSFETAELQSHAERLERIAAELRSEHPKASIDIEIVRQYRNMRDGMDKEPRALTKAVEAVEAAGLACRRSIIRGGTDGSRLTELGLPTPNLSTGEHNMHSPLEWTSVEEMQQAVDVLIKLAEGWGRESC